MGQRESTEFQGTIGRVLADSEPHFMEPPHPGEEAPNVVIVLMDDTGFAQFGCYGSDIDTPHVDALAADGVQFTNFHVTPLCSPTRAALLTGRSQHAVGMRGVSNWRTGFPQPARPHLELSGNDRRGAPAAEGYATFCAGKWHLAPTTRHLRCRTLRPVAPGAGLRPLLRIPRRRDRSVPPGAGARQHPHRSTRHPADDGYHVTSEDLVDQLLLMINDSKGVRPDRPFFAYLPFGPRTRRTRRRRPISTKYRGRYRRGLGRRATTMVRAAARTGRHLTADTRVGAPKRRASRPWDDVARQSEVAGLSTPGGVRRVP